MVAEGIKFARYPKPNNLKILRICWYFLRSVVLRGLYNTVKMGILEMRYEKRYGINTLAPGQRREKENYEYQGAGYGIIIKLFRDLVKGREGFHFVDIGCGKGRAVIVAAEAGFRRVTGIELYEDLLKEAAENIKKSPVTTNSAITLLHTNAILHDYTDEPAIYFLFNPFGETVLRSVVQKIIQNTRSETFFIYMNPRHASVFAELGIQKHRVYKTRFYTEAILYHLKANQS